MPWRRPERATVPAVRPQRRGSHRYSVAPAALPLSPAAPRRTRCPSARLARAGARAHLRRPRLLARAGVAMQRAALDGLVDRADELSVLRVGRGGVAARDRGPQAAEVRPDRRRVSAVLEALALGALDPLLL